MVGFIWQERKHKLNTTVSILTYSKGISLWFSSSPVPGPFFHETPGRGTPRRSGLISPVIRKAGAQQKEAEMTKSMTRQTTGRLAGLALVAGLVLLGGCQTERPVELPPFYRDLATVNASVDQQAALQMINQYRQNNGLAPLMLDPALGAIAQSQARAIAGADSIRASLEPQNQLKTRLSTIGETKTDAVENVSAGYRTLAEAFSGWRESPGHNKVMLDPRATRMGIATTYAPGSKYKVFWSLVLASPRQ